MKTRMLLTASVVLVAVGACSRNDEPEMPPGVELNKQTGVVTTKQGIQANGMSAAGACLSPSDMQRSPADFSPDQRRQIVACMNAQLAAQINPQLPRQVDQITRLDRIEANGPTVTYHYTVLQDLPANAAQTIEQMGRRLVCSQAAMRQTLQMGGAYAYRYMNSQGGLIHQFRIDAC